MTNTPSIERLTRPIIGIENRTALEVFDIMADRIRSTLTPSAGEVERIETLEAALYPFSRLLKNDDPRTSDGAMVVAQYGFTKMYGLSLGDLRRARAALASPPLPHPDIEGRAREMLAEFCESEGNKAAAFTVRQVGPTGIVLESQHAALVYALSLPTTEIRREALLNGCNALLGLVQLILARDDLPADLREALSNSHRIDEAKAAVRLATQKDTEQ